MNCKRVQKLIPLHVGGDLHTTVADRVESHLEWCGRCNWLADEYKESQRWLHAPQPPAFDETFLDDFKRGVMSRVAETNPRPSLIASLAQQWNRRQILVLAATFVVVLGLISLYFYQSRLKRDLQMTSRLVEQPTRDDLETGKQTQPVPTPEVAPGAGSGKSHLASNGRRHFRSRSAQYVLAEPSVKRTLATQTSGTSEAANALPDQTGAVAGPTNRSRDMLRIEIQTGDPSIRIIWFAPKDTDLHQSKPATD